MKLNLAWFKQPILLILLISFVHNFANADVLFESDFATFNSGDLSGQNGWDAQNGWQVAGGFATNSGSWTRARNTTGFSLNPGQSVKMTMEIQLIGSSNGSELARFGFAKSNEHTGANTPQVFAPISWNGSTLDVGGAVINNYASGELVLVEMTLTMLPQIDGWQRIVVLSNLSNPSTAESEQTAVDSVGSVSDETVWEWLDLGGQANFGIRSFDNPTSATVGIASVLFETGVTPGLPSATPNLLNSNAGQLVGGELADVVESDDAFLEYYPELPIQSSTFPLSLEFTTFLPEAPQSTLLLNFESGSNSPGVTRFLEVLRWGTEQYEIVDISPETLVDGAIQLELSNAINAYVDPAGRIKIRVSWLATEPVLFYPWKVRTDQVQFEFE